MVRITKEEVDQFFITSEKMIIRVKEMVEQYCIAKNIYIKYEGRIDDRFYPHYDKISDWIRKDKEGKYYLNIPIEYDSCIDFYIKIDPHFFSDEKEWGKYLNSIVKDGEDKDKLEKEKKQMLKEDSNEREMVEN